ncbi:4-hydroxy-3-methylbut-2-enyl [Carex littledalei]|uniref:4-hydroxy-3-methylbut-2-enyl n=1 Tax=Carex littledalei TaxID=544730 RepID=A0A833QC73_9POAL|nr:4-hydroxy-3-methylbut-2-enyl [Carex littledalei]
MAMAMMAISAPFGSGALGVRSKVRPPMFLTVRYAATGDNTSLPLDSAKFDKKRFRHDWTRSDNYNRKGFGHKKETLELMNSQYTS